MNIRRHTLLIFIIVSFLLILAGCISPEQSSQQPDTTPTPIIHQTSSETLTPTPELSPTRVSIPTITPFPTVSSENELRVVELLQSNDCILPCYLNIIPGEATLRNAETNLRNLGANYWTDFMRGDGSIGYAYTLYIGDPSLIEYTPEPNSPIANIKHDIILIPDNNDTIQLIEIYISASKLMPKFQEYWSNYSVREIFLRLGIPNQIYTLASEIDTELNYIGYHLLIDYKKYGVVFELSGRKQGGSICPSYGGDILNVYLSLYNPDSKLGTNNRGRSQLADRDAWVPINEILGIDYREFYNQLIQNPSFCIEIEQTH